MHIFQDLRTPCQHRWINDDSEVLRLAEDEWSEHLVIQMSSMVGWSLEHD